MVDTPPLTRDHWSVADEGNPAAQDPALGQLEKEPPSPATVRRATLSGAAGFFMETYDFQIYGLVAAYLSVEFFTETHTTTALLLTWAVFAIPFVVRPLGGLILGAFADKVGRKKVMLFSIVGIAGSTAAIGMIPSYAAIGIAAPIAVVCLRLVQGLAYGGETASAVSFVGEWTPAKTRASRLAWVQSGSSAGGLVGTLLAFGLSFGLGPVLMQAWGWRVLFLVAIPLSTIALFIRAKVDETPAFRELEEQGEIVDSPIKSTFSERRTRVAMVKCFLVGALFATGYYIIYIQLPAYLVSESGFSSTAGLSITLLGFAFLQILTPLWGYAADRWGRRVLGFSSSLVMVLIAVPCFVLMSSTDEVRWAVAGVLVLTLVYAVQPAIALGTLFELLETGTRSTAFSLSWGVSAAVFGGAAPFIATGLIALTGWSASPSLLIVVAGSLSALGYLWFREDRQHITTSTS